MAAGTRDISALITAWGDGDEQALGNLIPLLYPELRRIARLQLHRWRPGHTLESAALANEAYLKLMRTDGIRCETAYTFSPFVPRSSGAFSSITPEAVAMPNVAVMRYVSRWMKHCWECVTAESTCWL
jgi:hypothetical protein